MHARRWRGCEAWTAEEVARLGLDGAVMVMAIMVVGEGKMKLP